MIWWVLHHADDNNETSDINWRKNETSNHLIIKFYNKGLDSSAVDISWNEIWVVPNWHLNNIISTSIWTSIECRIDAHDVNMKSFWNSISTCYSKHKTEKHQLTLGPCLADREDTIFYCSHIVISYTLLKRQYLKSCFKILST